MATEAPTSHRAAPARRLPRTGGQRRPGTTPVLDSRERWFWLALMAVATVFAGVPGHLVPWFSGDLAYHIGVSRTISVTHPAGFGPYGGLPSYYGGTFPLVLQLIHQIGPSPETALAVLSWFEPACWVASAAYLACALWPRSRTARISFVVLLLAGAGVGVSHRDLSVNSPNVAGQMFWPLYPRDVTLMLTLLAIGCAVRGRWVRAGVLCGLAVATEVQVGALTCLLVVLALLMCSVTSGRLRIAAQSMGVAALTSAWWWGPRVFWVASYGMSGQGGPFEGDLPHTWRVAADGYGLVLVLAVVGVVVALRRPRDRIDRFLLVWTGVAVLTLLASLLASTELLSYRRTLVLASLPVAAMAAVGVDGLRWPSRRARRAGLAVVVCGVILAPSLPTLLRTRAAVEDQFADTTIASYGYPEASWAPLWQRLRTGSGEVLAPPRDAAVAWFQTGRPVSWGVLPGYVKTWFDVRASTGWSEQARESAVTTAYSGSLPALCRLARRRHVDDVLLRSMPGMVGVLDQAGPQALARLEVPAQQAGPTGSVNALAVPVGATVTLPAEAVSSVRALSVWVPGNPRRPPFALEQHGRHLVSTHQVGDGRLTRFDFTVPSRGATPLVLAGPQGRGFRIDRIVGYQEFAGPTTGPATLVPPSRLCL